jgi:signal transduction histidine kinase/DNA-binding response OmpR family regulator
VNNHGLRQTIQFTTTLVVVSLSLILMLLMSFFMGALTDSILMKTMPSMARSAAQSIEGHLHILGDRLLTFRENLQVTGVDEREAREFLDSRLEGVEFSWVGLYSPESGQMVTGSSGAPPNIDNRRMFSLIRITENLVIGDTYDGHELEISMGAPVMEYRSIRYILAGSYKYDMLNDVLGNINISAASAAFIINNQGQLQAHQNSHLAEGWGTIFDEYGNSRAVEDLLLQIGQGSVGSVLLRQEGLFSFFNSRNAHLFSFAPIRGTRWSLVIEAPRTDFMAAARQATVISILVTILLLVIVTLGFSIFIRRVLTEPIRALTASAHRLALGQFSQEIPPNLVGRNDEIGLLGDAYVTMVDSIKDVIVDIDHITWAARTGNLDQRSPLSYHQGDYYRIISGVNTTLDIICAQLDTIPEALALLGEDRKFRYCNKAMKDFLARNQLDTADGSILAYITTSGESRELPEDITALFAPDSGPAPDSGLDPAGEPPSGAYTSAIALEEKPGGASNYVMALRRTGSTAAIADGSGPGTSGSSRLADQIAALMGVTPRFSGSQNDRDGAPVCVMLILSDVTQLTQARIGAEQASRAKGDFLSRMSHEMRTPMNAIIGMTHIARNSPDGERKDYCLDKIDDASNHLLGVINDILDMSKIEANKFELSPAEFNFEQMIMRVTNVVNFRIEEKHQKFTVHLDPKIPSTLVGDDQRLAQVIANLLSNAVKFTPENGTITLEATLEGMIDAAEPPGRPRCTVNIAVSDTGIGITQEQRGRLFTSFEQADGSISRKFGGTGLGLAISKRIVELMGGTIQVDSTPGAGSTFRFTIDAEQGTEARPAPFREGVNITELRLLMADDDPEVRDYFATILQSLGLSAELAASGEEVLEKMTRNGGYDLYFIDRKLPGPDIFELVRRIKDNPAALPVVVLVSAADWSPLEQDAKKAGVDKFLPKPLFSSAIVDTVNQVMGKGAALTRAGMFSSLETGSAGAAKNAAPGTAEFSGGGEDTDIFEGRRIILAEDVEINREIVITLLEPTGLAIDCAENGAVAVRLFAENPARYDLIFMDVHMPEMDGFEATRRIRDLDFPRAKNIPIVAMTANVFKEDIDKCLASGMNDHVGKPLDMTIVMDKLRRYLPRAS